MKVYWGVEIQLLAFLTSALDGGEWSASRPGRFTQMATKKKQETTEMRVQILSCACLSTELDLLA
jgi:hypothetical protein